MWNPLQFRTLTHDNWQQECTSMGFLQCWGETMSQERLENHSARLQEGGLPLAGVSCEAGNVFLLALGIHCTTKVFCRWRLTEQALKMEDKWVRAITNCLLGAVGLCGKTWAGEDGFCRQLELTAQIWHHWSWQQCRTELWRGRLALCHPCGAIIR